MDRVTDVINSVIGLKGSTTLYLESLSSRPLNVVVESQEVIREMGDKVLKRTVKLFFDSVSQPVLFCISNLYINELKEEEYSWLTETLIPIGKIFHHFNGEAAIRKRSVLVLRHHDPAIAGLLHVDLPDITSKTYDYWVGERKIGRISEFFNDESLNRIWNTKSIELL